MISNYAAIIPFMHNYDWIILKEAIPSMSFFVPCFSQVDIAGVYGQTLLNADDGGDVGAGLPAWLRDRKYLNPLLTAYDERICSLEEQLRERSAGLAGLQRQVSSSCSTRFQPG